MPRKSLRNRLKRFSKTYFTGSLSSMQVAQCVSFGLLWGVFPLVGTSTVLCTISAIGLRLNIAVIQGINYLVYPLQLALLLPFMNLGAFLTGTSIIIPTFDELKLIASEWQLSAAAELSGDILQIFINALAGWAIIAPILSAAAGSAIYFVFEARKSNFASEKAQQP